MDYGVVTTAGPTTEPVSLAEAKAQCWVTHDADDALIGGLVSAARDLAERHTGRFLAARDALTVSFGRYPAWDGDGSEAVRLPVEPVSAVTAVRYRDGAGSLVTVDPGAYQTWLAHSPPLVAPAAGTCWPWWRVCPAWFGQRPLAAVEVDVAVPASCPKAAKQAILLAVGYWYGHRGDGGDPERDGLPPAAVRLLNLTDVGGYR